MSVVARILEGTVAMSFVEMAAWNFTEGHSILINELILFGSIFEHLGGRNDQVTILTTYRASPIMRLLNLFVVGCSPITYTVKTETMGAVLKDTKSFTVAQDWF